jgi:hypothetical protein
MRVVFTRVGGVGGGGRPPTFDGQSTDLYIFSVHAMYMYISYGT